jgi:2-C-methyl-D-erythritol 4-phosphate cytidylyltransferase
MTDKIVAIVPAAGLGKRFGEGTNKPFAMLGDKPVLIWALEALSSMPDIQEIIPVVKESDMQYVIDLFDQYEMSKVRRIAPGGRERQDSVFHGLKLVDDRRSVVLVHDGVRPLIEPHVIDVAINQLKGHDGVVVGVPVKDTIKEADGCTVRQTLKRGTLWAIQTPQIFPFHTLYSAYERAMEESFYSTDDSALVERYGGRIKVSMGSYTNIKVTTPEDLQVAEIFLKMREQKG